MPRKTIILSLFLILFLPVGGNTNMRGRALKSLKNGYFYNYRKLYKIPGSFGQREMDSLFAYTKRYKIPEHLAFRLIKSESNFDSGAVNRSSGARGCCQLHPRYFDFCNRFENMRLGMELLMKLRRISDSWAEAVMRYGGKKKITKNIKWITNDN